MPLLVMRPVDGLQGRSRWVLFDLGAGSEVVDDKSTQMISVIGRIGHPMPDAFQPFDQAARLRAVAPLAGVMGTRIGRPSASTAAWILVVRPPLERAIAGACAPFLRRLHPSPGRRLRRNLPRGGMGLQMAASARTYSKAGSWLNALKP